MSDGLEVVSDFFSLESGDLLFQLIKIPIVQPRLCSISGSQNNQVHIEAESLSRHNIDSQVRRQGVGRHRT